MLAHKALHSVPPLLSLLSPWNMELQPCCLVLLVLSAKILSLLYLMDSFSPDFSCHVTSTKSLI